MKQRVITVFSPIKPNGVTNWDAIIKDEVESKGYIVKQIVSTSFEDVSVTGPQKIPKLAITLLLEKLDN